jgi:hypothetical protein
MAALLAAAVAAVFVGPSDAQAQFAEYYIGRDQRATVAGTGTYGGLPDPNFNRITFLYAHTYPTTPTSNHYHGKSNYTYFGPNAGAATTVQPYNGNASGAETGNFLPESGPPIPLTYDSAGVFNNRFRTGLTPGVPFSNMRLRSVNSLSGFATGSPEQILFDSSAGRWNGLITGSNLNLVLVSTSHPDLDVFDQIGNPILTGNGQSYNLGSGATLDFTPVLAMPGGTPFGNYWARFKITDTGTGNAGGPWGESGEFVMNFAVPEPGTMLGLPIAAIGLLARRRRK